MVQTSSRCWVWINKRWMFPPQMCVWPSMSPSPLHPSRWPRRVRTSRSPASCPSDDATLPCQWWSGASCRRGRSDPRMSSSSPASTWGRHAFTATTPRVSWGPKWSWRWWSRGRCLTCSSWTCPRGTGASTCAGCKSLKSTRTDGRPLRTALQPPSSEVRAGFHLWLLRGRFFWLILVDINSETTQVAVIFLCSVGAQDQVQ